MHDMAATQADNHFVEKGKCSVESTVLSDADSILSVEAAEGDKEQKI